MKARAAQKLMWEALREAVDEEMEADPTVCLMGASAPCPHAMHIGMLPCTHLALWCCCFLGVNLTCACQVRMWATMGAPTRSPTTCTKSTAT